MLRSLDLLEGMQADAADQWVFSNGRGRPWANSHLEHVHKRVREALKLPADFVLHSLRHTMLTRLGEAGVDVFTLMRIAGHASIGMSQRYVHPSSDAVKKRSRNWGTQKAESVK